MMKAKTKKKKKKVKGRSERRLRPFKFLHGKRRRLFRVVLVSSGKIRYCAKSSLFLGVADPENSGPLFFGSTPMKWTEEEEEKKKKETNLSQSHCYFLIFSEIIITDSQLTFVRYVDGIGEVNDA